MCSYTVLTFRFIPTPKKKKKKKKKKLKRMHENKKRRLFGLISASDRASRRTKVSVGGQGGVAQDHAVVVVVAAKVN